MFSGNQRDVLREKEIQSSGDSLTFDINILTKRD